MPNNLLFADMSMFPVIGEDEETKSALKKILNYQFLLTEQLRYTLYNLEGDNFNQKAWHEIFDPIYVKLEDTTQGLRTELSLTAEGLALEIENTAQGLRTEIDTTAKGITAQVENARGEISTVKQTADKIYWLVQDPEEGSESEFALTPNAANLIIQKVSDSGNFVAQTTFTQTVDKQGAQIALVVQDGAIKAGAIIQAINGESNATIQADKINLKGYVTVSSLESGETTIDGGCITTGTISAERIDTVGLRVGYLSGLDNGAGKAYIEEDSFYIYGNNGNQIFCVQQEAGSLVNLYLYKKRAFYLDPVSSGAVLWHKMETRFSKDANFDSAAYFMHTAEFHSKAEFHSTAKFYDNVSFGQVGHEGENTIYFYDEVRFLGPVVGI